MKKPPTKDILLVIIQIFLFIVYFIPVLNYSFQVNPLFKFVAVLAVIAGLLILFIAFIQLNRNLTPFPTPIEEGTLIQTGLYKYIRHPVYTGFIVTALGYGVFTNSIWRIIISFALWILFYFKSSYEEKLLVKKYKDYHMYKKRTGRFFPDV